MVKTSMRLIEASSQGLKHEFKMTLLAETITAKANARLAEIGQTLRLPGFRPGRVPMTLVRKRYHSAVRAEVIAASVQESTSWVLKEYNLRPALKPRVYVTSDQGGEKGEDIAFTITLEVMPEIPVIDFTALHVEQLRTEVDEQAISKAIERLAFARRRLELIKEDRPACFGDIAVVDIKGTIGGSQDTESLSKTDFLLDLGTDTFMSGFAEAVIGIRKGDVRTFSLALPETDAIVPIGKIATFTVALKELQEVVDTPAGDVLANSYGMEDFGSLRAEVRAKLEQEYTAQSKLRMKEALLEEISSAYVFEIPSGMLEIEAHAIQQQLVSARALNRANTGSTDETADNDEALKAQCRSAAERRVRLRLILAEVGRCYNVFLTKADLEHALTMEAKYLSAPLKSVLEQRCQTPATLNAWKASLLEDKIINFIISMVTVTVDRVVTVEELLESSSTRMNLSV